MVRINEVLRGLGEGVIQETKHSTLRHSRQWKHSGESQEGMGGFGHFISFQSP